MAAHWSFFLPKCLIQNFVIFVFVNWSNFLYLLTGVQLQCLLKIATAKSNNKPIMFVNTRKIKGKNLGITTVKLYNE